MNKRGIRFFILFAAIIGVVWGGYALLSSFRYNPAKAIADYEKRYVEAMTADTYGGKTPQETLDLFVEALRAEDVELAHKYFFLGEKLDRSEWLSYLEDIKNRGLLQKMADDIANDAKPLGSIYENDFGFGLFNDDGTIGVQIDMRFNEFSGVWKIEQL